MAEQSKGEQKFDCKRNHIRRRKEGKEKPQLLLKDATGKKEKKKKEKYFVLFCLFLAAAKSKSAFETFTKPICL